MSVGVAVEDGPAPASGPTTPRPVGIPHVAAFDGVRGLAVAAVLLEHAGELSPTLRPRFEGGYLGVDLFFVLSGYLITALLLSGWRAGGSVGLRTFWARRARRLAPALLVTLVAVGIYATVIAHPTERLGIRWDGLASLFEVANWRTIATNGDYFARTLVPSPLRHTWSLSIEEQAYLLWPLAVAGLLRWRRSVTAVFAVALGGALASSAWLVWLQHDGASQSRLYYGTDTRAFAILFGAAVASGRVVLGPKAWARTRPLRHTLGLVAALGLAWAWWGLDGNTTLPYRGVLPLVGVAGALVVASVADRRHPGPLGQFASLPPLQALGRISYGVYLYHWPIYLVLDHSRTHLSGWALVALDVAVTIGLAWVSYTYLEQPIRRGRLLGAREARAALPAGAAVAAIALFAGTLGAVPAPSLGNISNQIVRSSTPGAPLILLAGDSVPLLLGVQLGQQVDELGVSVVNRAQPGCHLLAALGPIRGVEGNVRTDVADCAANGKYRADVEALHPDVAVAMFGEFPNEAVKIDGAWVMPCQPAYLAALRKQLDHLVDDLRASGASVVLLTAPGTNVSWILERVKPGMAERVACTNQVIDDLAAARPGVSVVDLASYICPPQQACLEDVDGVNLREDGLHFQGDGAAYVNRWLVPQVLAAAQTG